MRHRPVLLLFLSDDRETAITHSLGLVYCFVFCPCGESSVRLLNALVEQKSAFWLFSSLSILSNLEILKGSRKVPSCLRYWHLPKTSLRNQEQQL